MPPYAGVRKGSLMSNSPSLANGVSDQRRTTSGRAVRANTTRPTNYYARPFANMTAEDSEDIAPPLGFFPAITFFSDAIAALPREVVRQFTLVKEVEAKIHGPAAQLGAMCDELMTLPVPSKQVGQLQSALMMSFTAPNSNAGSANASLINGVAPNASRYGQDSAAGSVTGEELAQETEDGLNRRKKYAELRTLAHSMLPNLDEKNVVLTEAIRVMNTQLMRIDGVMPHVENEIPEEARLGSMTHWAYSDNRQRTKAAAAQSRRDVVATNSLAAAANAVHESDIAQTRRDAMKEARALGKGRTREQIDSEFEDKPRKTAKGVRNKPAAATGLGITNGEPVKRRKVEKTGGTTPATMERQSSSMGKIKTQKETPKSTPAEDMAKRIKTTKPAPLPQAKRRGLNSAQASPALASSPLQTQMSQSMEPPGGRPQSARLRQNSTASNLRHEKLAEEGSRPGSATGKSTAADKPPSRKRTRDDLEIDTTHVETIEQDGVQSPAKMDDVRPQPSRSNSSNKTPSGGASKVGTPWAENFGSTDASMVRSRSTRSGRKEDAPAGAQHGHKRNGGVGGSMSGLMKQIAPFNRSPDLDRRRSRDDMTESSDDDDDEHAAKRQRSASIRQKTEHSSRSISRHNSGRRGSSAHETGPDEQLRAEDEAEPENVATGDEDMPDAMEPPALIPDADDEPDTPSPSLTPVMASYDEPEEPQEYPEDEISEVEQAAEAQADVEDADEEGDEPDPDDPDEPKYCYCMRGSYGDMVGCDNAESCPREWFHLGCTGLKRMPTEAESWYCDYCKPMVANRRRGLARGRGRG